MQNATELTPTKQITLFLSTEEIDLLEQIAIHRELSFTDIFVRYIRDDHAAIMSLKSDTLELEREHFDVLSILVHKGGKAMTDEISRYMFEDGWNANWCGLGRTLNDLRRHGYIEKRGSKYMITAQGRALRNW